ncbi:TPA: type I 3-dehydroquinate dehydratase, partial [Haemophilus influenzae]
MAAVFSVCACFMCSCLVVKNTVIGSGRTKIAVPLVARDAAELSAVLEQIKNMPFDIAEFRADFLECAGSIGEILHHTQTVRDALPDKPLLFTFRRHGEGGSFPCSDDYYFELLDALIESRLPDIIDIE